MTSTIASRILPSEVHKTLSRHILADGHDLVFDYERSQGSWFFDAKRGRKLLDFMTFFASLPVGYNHPKMKEPAFLEVLHRVAQLKPSVADVYNVEYAQFVETFAEKAAPRYLPHLFFIEGGTLAVENCLKVAFDWKVRRNKAKGIPGERGTQVIHFREAFHGRSGYALSLTNTDPVKTDYFPKFPWPRIENPKLRFPLDAAVERDVAAAEQRAIDQIKRAFEDHPDDIAAIVIEPIQAEGGDNHFRAEFLQQLERVCRENACFFIVDEVQTGVGITGKMWAHEHFDLRPDALAFGKKTQVCGCMVGPKVDEEPHNVFRVGSRINSTWGGGLTDMVRFGRFLEIIIDERLVENARSVGEHLLRGLREVAHELSGVVENARGRGLMIAFDLETPELRKRALERCRENGLLALPCGPRSIRFRPPLTLRADEADTGLDILRASLKTL
jgi:L-lysine 6-transaminase